MNNRGYPTMSFFCLRSCTGTSNTPSLKFSMLRNVTSKSKDLGVLTYNIKMYFKEIVYEVLNWRTLKRDQLRALVYGYNPSASVNDRIFEASLHTVSYESYTIFKWKYLS